MTLEVDKRGSSLLPTLLQVVLYMKIENAFICPCEIGTALLNPSTMVIVAGK